MWPETKKSQVRFLVNTPCWERHRNTTSCRISLKGSLVLKVLLGKPVQTWHPTTGDRALSQNPPFSQPLPHPFLLLIVSSYLWCHVSSSPTASHSLITVIVIVTVTVIVCRHYCLPSPSHRRIRPSRPRLQRYRPSTQATGQSRRLTVKHGCGGAGHGRGGLPGYAAVGGFTSFWSALELLAMAEWVGREQREVEREAWLSKREKAFEKG
ncbi:hypothetical protein RIF29_15594 [Crotalaria pallida]|uniref:Uncharacterized protein n=1 Tax=Crotalaria pallida TaxID=3830 RepID=A0AAN9FDS2_CROPI